MYPLCVFCKVFPPLAIKDHQFSFETQNTVSGYISWLTYVICDDSAVYFLVIL